MIYKVDKLLNLKETRSTLIYCMLMAMPERRQQETISGRCFCLLSGTKKFINKNYIARFQALRHGVNKTFVRSHLKIKAL